MTFSSDTLRRSSIGMRLKLSFWNWSLFRETESVKKQAKHSGEKKKEEHVQCFEQAQCCLEHRGSAVPSGADVTR
jgi:hypothetical protein